MKLSNIQDVAATLGVSNTYLEPYGRHRAKVHLDALKDAPASPRGKYVLVAGMTPTPLGEGKTTTCIGLAMALCRAGRRAVVTLRQSSLGPVFGAKGGGAGGGRARIEPLTESILHLTGDFHAVGQAHNLMGALLDNHLFHGNAKRFAPERIQLRRVLDVNDRFLRHINTGLGTATEGLTRESGFDITAASEVMAILALADGRSYAEAMHSLRARLGRMVLGFSEAGTPITADDISAAGAAAALLTEAIKPNLMQTSEGTPAILHAGPFANIAHGSSSILADRLGLMLGDYVVTEAGFGMDIGGEKFFDIKCRASGLYPSVVVLVSTVRALKFHSGKYPIKGRALPPDLFAERPDDVRAGGVNLARQISNAARFGAPVVVAVNRFEGDHASELEELAKVAKEAGASATVVNSAFLQGSEGALELADAVAKLAEGKPAPRLLYPDELPLEQKLRTVALEMYGADGVDLAPRAREQIDLYTQHGFGRLPVCIAKTHLSLSHDAAKVGAPSGFTLPIRDVRLSAGAGFVYALAGSIMTMPGLGEAPAANQIDIDERGEVVGIF